MVRQRKGLLALCLLMLITALCTLGGISVSAEEKLFKARDGIFQSDTYNFDEGCGNCGYIGVSISKTAYKYVSEYDGTYYYYDKMLFVTDSLV